MVPKEKRLCFQHKSTIANTYCIILLFVLFLVCWRIPLENSSHFVVKLCRPPGKGTHEFVPNSRFCQGSAWFPISLVPSDAEVETSKGLSWAKSLHISCTTEFQYDKVFVYFNWFHHKESCVSEVLAIKFHPSNLSHQNFSGTSLWYSQIKTGISLRCRLA